MSSPDPPTSGPLDAGALADAVARVEVDALQRAYADAVNRRAWDDLEALFRPDATVELDLGERGHRTLEGPATVSGFIRGALERFRFFQLVVLTSKVDLRPEGRPETASARLTITELRVPVDGDERDDSFGVYHDRYVRTPDGWRIEHRHYRSITPGPLPP